MATFIQYQLVSPYTLGTWGGGTIRVAEGRDLDVKAALVAGSGTISADQSDTALIAALDGYWVLARVGTTTTGTAAPLRWKGGIAGDLTGPTPGEPLLLSSDMRYAANESGYFANTDAFKFSGDRLSTFKTALANRNTAGVNVLVVGHSIAEGDHANLTTRWQAKLRDALRTRYSTTGLGTGGGIGSLPPQYKGGSADGNLTGSLPVVLAGAPTDSAAGLGGRGVQLTSGKTATFTFTGTGFDLSYLKGSGGTTTATYNIDGAGAVTLNTNAASTSYNVLQIRSLSAGTHSVVFSGGAANTFFVNDVMVYNGDESSGIRFWDGAHSGWTAGDFIETATNGSAYARYTLFGQPHLVIIESGGINEWGTVDTLRKSPRQMREDLLDLIDGISANCTTVPSIIMFLDHKRGLPVGQFRGPWARYGEMVNRVAQEAGAVVFDSQAVLGDAATDPNGWFASDKTHPLAAGHTAIANALDSLIASA